MRPPYKLSTHAALSSLPFSNLGSVILLVVCAMCSHHTFLAVSYDVTLASRHYLTMSMPCIGTCATALFQTVACRHVWFVCMCCEYDCA
jgi:hypothetical protein